MRTYTISRSTTNPPDWSNVAPLFVDQFLWTPPVHIHMQAKLCYDQTAIYIYQYAAEPNIRAEHTGPYSMVCEDSCMEFFLAPVADDPRFFNFECNPNACMFIGLETCCDDIIRLHPLEENSVFQQKTARVAGGWELSYRIPYSFIQMFFPSFYPSSGHSMLANCYKSGDLTEQPHYMAWNPVRHNTPDFHRKSDFGRMIFE